MARPASGRLGRIDRLRTDPQDPQCVDVLVGGRVVGRASRAQAEALGLRAGAGWTPHRAAALSHAGAEDAARQRAFGLLARRARSRSALVAALERAGFAEPVATAVVERLQQDGWLCEERSAAERARAVARNRGTSRRLVQTRLESEGFSERLAGAASRSASGPADELDQAVELTKSYIRARVRRVESLAMRLDRRGFDRDTITQALRICGLDSSFLEENS